MTVRHAWKLGRAMVKVRSSRRVAGLKPGDYDHEIGLVNHDEADIDSRTILTSTADTCRGSTPSRLVSLVGDSEVEDASRVETSETDGIGTHSQQNGVTTEVSEEEENRLQPEDSLPHASMQPSIEVQGKALCPT